MILFHAVIHVQNQRNGNFQTLHLPKQQSNQFQMISIYMLWCNNSNNSNEYTRKCFCRHCCPSYFYCCPSYFYCCPSYFCSTSAAPTSTAVVTTSVSETFTDLQCKCDEIDYCDLKETMCPSITDPFECAERGCQRGPDTNNFQCVNRDIPHTNFTRFRL